MIRHAYLKYAAALLMKGNRLSKESDITFAHIKTEIANGLKSFCVKPKNSFEGRDSVIFEFTNEPNDAKNNIFLSPNAITTEMQASNLYNAAKKICEESQELELGKANKVSQSQVPIAGEFCAFSDNGKIGRGHPKASNLSISLGLITSTTPFKPCLQYVSSRNGKESTENVCLIPDLEIPQLIDFIDLFMRMHKQKLPDDIMNGKVDAIKGKSNVTYKPKRPLLFRGNFPNAPRSSALGTIALLGAIGEMVKESDASKLALRVLDSFKGSNFYAFKYGDAQIFQFNHYIIELAKEGRLRSIVDSMYHVSLYKQGIRRNPDNIPNRNDDDYPTYLGNILEYQKFDLFASRFLQLFNKPAFLDFLAFRAEYPEKLEILLKSYFIHMEKIKEDIVLSAKALGHWLNWVAYQVAAREKTKTEAENESKEKELIRAIKAKVLVELESSIFSSKSADALIAHTLTRAGRLSATDAPAEASLFMEKVACGELPLEQAKNLLIAFSRLKSTTSKSSDAANAQEDDSFSQTASQESFIPDYSNI